MGENVEQKVDPEILNGVPVCRKECGFWSKEKVGRDVVIRCRRDNCEVFFRPVCVSWLAEKDALNQKNLEDNQNTIIGLVAKLTDLESKLRNSENERKSREQWLVQAKSDLLKIKKRLVEKEKEIAKLNQDAMVEDYERQRQWVLLKEVQEFRKDYRIYKEKIEKLTEQNQKMKTDLEKREAENLRLIREDMSKAEIIKKITVDKKSKMDCGEKKEDVANA